MELFKNEFLKKEYESFQKNELIKVLNCGLCMKTSCEWFHNKYEASCQNCRQTFCKDCKNFIISFEMFLKNTDEIGNDYLKNFVSDFLNISISTLHFFFQK